MTKHEALHEHEGEVLEEPLEELLRRRERDQQLKEKRSAAARKGWVTRRSAEGFCAHIMRPSRRCDCSGDRSHFFFGDP